MNNFEKVISNLRHSKIIRSEKFWSFLRPAYECLLKILFPFGLKRNVNGTDLIKVGITSRGVPNVYEPTLWKKIMDEIRPGDQVVEVGCFLGIYVLALAGLVGSRGKIYGFEPDPWNFKCLKENVELNRFQDRVSLFNLAVSDKKDKIFFEKGNGCISKIAAGPSEKTISIDSVTLDSVFPSSKIDMLLIDVEGFEEPVLKGFLKGLSQPELSPRIIYIEMHPFNWHLCDTTSNSILSLLEKTGYSIFDLNGEVVDRIHEYGHVIARKQ